MAIEKGLPPLDPADEGLQSLQGIPLPSGTMPKCSIPTCTVPAIAQAFQYDVQGGEPIWRSDDSCPFLCRTHLAANEAETIGERKPGGKVEYIYTNQSQATGFTVYKPLA